MATKATLITRPEQLSAKIIKEIDRVASYSGHYVTQTFEDWVSMIACALSMGKREDEYKIVASRYKPAELESLHSLFAEFVNDYDKLDHADILGPIHMEIGSSKAKQASGEFYTPWALCQLMAKMAIGDKPVIPDDRPLSISEPACGAGATILAAAQHFRTLGFSPLNMIVQAVDVSRLAVRMCFIQLSLWGIPAVVIHGNTLSGEVWDQFHTPTYHMAEGLNPYAKWASLLQLIRESAPKEELPIERFPIDIEFQGQGAFNFGGLA